VPLGVIGKVTIDPRLSIRGIYGTQVIDTELASLKDAWLLPFKRLYG
jgi:hypothetical protein